MNPPALTPTRDVFLSHRSADKEFVRNLAADICEMYVDDRKMTVWLDEAEIRPGQSIPGMINYGLENSRFIAFVMTPEYFQSESGWTDAEWHAALHLDPDNRQSRLLPILAADCPYIPVLLRHLSMIDLRGNNYPTEINRLNSLLRGDRVPATFRHRGQLIRSDHRIDRSTLVAERAVADGNPDSVTESLSCNLLNVERLPPYLYKAELRNGILNAARASGRRTTKDDLKDLIRQSQLDEGIEKPRVPAFRLAGDHIYSFHDLEAEESELGAIVESGTVEIARVNDSVLDEDRRRILISLLNMSIGRYLHSRGLQADPTRMSRYYFPSDNGKPRVIGWKPWKKTARRTVTKQYVDRAGLTKYWLHQAAYIKAAFFGSAFYVQITPTWLLTEDGESLVKGGPEVGKVIIPWTGRERNLSVLYHIRFWTNVLRAGPGPISIRAGDQTIELATAPAYIELPFGLSFDHKNTLEMLDENADAIATQENAGVLSTYQVNAAAVVSEEGSDEESEQE